MSPEKLDRLIHRELRAIRRSTWRIAESLYEFNAVQGWKALGFALQADYIHSLDMTRSDYHRYVRIWRVFGGIATARQVNELDISKLYIACSAVDNFLVTPQKALTDCERFTARALMIRYGFGRGAEPPPRSCANVEAVVSTLLALLSDKSLTAKAARRSAIDFCEETLRPLRRAA